VAQTPTRGRFAVGAQVIAGTALGAVLLLFMDQGGWTAQTTTVQNPAPAATRQSFEPALVERGARLAAIGNCSGCHTADAQAPYSGGVPIPTPFGRIYGSNITPDPTTGIGTWSQASFIRAMREGIARNGERLYPAFPYDHFNHADDGDLAALYAFAMTRVPVSSVPARNDLHFPFNVRPLLAVWDMLFVSRRPYQIDPRRDAQWNRGAYLVQSLAHCGACHTPRNALGAERLDAALSGGDAEGWYAPPLDSHAPTPLSWSVPQLTEYLRTGITANHAMAGGPMQGVTASLAQADVADVQAIATYIVSVMSAGSDQAGREQRDNANLRRAQQPLAQVASAGDDSQMKLGAQVYAQACASCHDLGRRTSSNGALRLQIAVAPYDDKPDSFLHIVHDGIIPADGEHGRWMPAFGAALDEQQLAALASYVRRYAADLPPWKDLKRAVNETTSGAVKASP